MAGGILPTTFMNRIQIKRIVPSGDRLKAGMDRTIIDYNLNELNGSSDNFELYDGDEIYFFKR